MRKQRYLLLKNIRDLGDRKAQNIFKLEMDEILNKEPNAILRILSSGREKFTNPFLMLLDSLNSIFVEPLGRQ